MNAPATGRESLLWRVLTKPVGPRILPRLPGFSRAPYASRVIESSGLPREAAELVGLVASRTRLWRSEQVDVARELCAHFADGLAAGRSESELIRDFGGPIEAAALIRRAKKRQRPLVWQAWSAGCRVAGVVMAMLLVLYACLWARFFMGTPTIAHNYSAEIVGRMGNVQEGDRAWPLYEQAAAELGLYSSLELRSRWGSIMPGDPDWAEVEEFCSRNAGMLALIRRGAARPSLGLDLRRPEARAMEDPGPIWGALDFEYVNTLWRFARLLREDAFAAAARGDGGRAVGDLVAITRIAGHCAEAPFSMTGGTAVGVFTNALQGTSQILAALPEAIPERGLVDLAHRFGSFGGGGTLRIDASGDRLDFLDLVQRSYTDDGRGDGWLTGAGWRRLASYTSNWWMAGAAPRRAMEPIARAAAPSRRAVLEVYERAWALAKEAGSRPMYAWTSDPDREVERVLVAQAGWVPSIGVFGEAVGGTYRAAENATQRRDATLVVIALELYHRAHGDYPARLEDLTPVYLPAVPIDRFDCKPLKYVLREGRPLVYSVGANRLDDGGFLPARRNANWRAAQWIPPASAPSAHGADWILWPPVEQTLDGDPIDRFVPRDRKPDSGG